MANRIKSLAYLSCFILASVVYNYTTSKKTDKEIVKNTIEQEADIVINTFSDDIADVDKK